MDWPFSQTHAGVERSRFHGLVRYAALLAFAALGTSAASAQVIVDTPTASPVNVNAGENATVTGTGSVTPTAGQNGISAAGGNVITVETGTVPGGGTVTGNNHGIFISGSTPTVDNSGEIVGETQSGIRLFAGGDVINRAGATITGQVEGVFASSNFSTVDNDGMIIGTTEEAVTLSAGGTVDNDGTLQSGLGAGQPAVRISGGTDATNRITNRGTISAPSVLSTGQAIFLQGVGGTIENLGATSEITGAAGIEADGETALVNEGTITGGSTGNGIAVQMDGGGSIENRAGATINGSEFFGIRIRGGAGSLTNRGQINSSVSITAGGDLTNDAVIDGPVQVTGTATGVTNTLTNNAGASITDGAEVDNDAEVTNHGSIRTDATFESALMIANGGNLTNSGTIEATDGTGLTFRASATANRIVNAASGQIIGAFGDGIAVESAPFDITNHGVIRSEGRIFGAGIFGSVDGTVVNSATGIIEQTRGGRPAIQFTGASVQTVENHGVINRDVLLGAGNDTARLGAGSAINGDLNGGADVDLLSLIAGSSANATLNLDEVLNFETFLVNAASTAWTTTGTASFSGGTTLEAGRLAVNGTLDSDVTVNGGTLGGDGMVGSVIANGGTVAPGNSIGTLIVAGDFTLGPGAIFEVEVNAAGQSDRVIVNNMGAVNLTGATLRVLAENGNYAPSTDYVIIRKDSPGAVIGTFATVTTNFAFLVPTVFYAAGDGNDVVLRLERSATMFPDVARTRNQRAVAGALELFPTDNPLFLAVLGQTAAGARLAFDALSGEVYATVAGTLSDDSRYVREAVLGRLMQASHTNGTLSAGGPQVASLDTQAYALGYDGKSLVDAPAPERAPLAFWTRAYGAWGDFDSDGNAASADRDLGGFISGMDASIGGSWRAGLATGASFSDVSVSDRNSSADVETYHLGGYVGGMAGPVALRGGGMWAWSDIDTSRAVIFPGFFERQTANYDADTGQLFGEVAYPTQMGGIALEPFGGLAFVSVDTDSFRERGGPQASLRGVNTDQDVGYTSLGIRAATTMMLGAMQVVPHISAAWLHAFDDVTPGASLAFATTGIGFAIEGVPLAEDSALLDAGIDFALGENATAGLSYTGQYGDGVTDNGVKGRFTWLF